jgi:hypothetical protein
MNTSAMIVEMIIIGFQALFWMALALVVAIGVDFSPMDPDLIVATAAAVPISYPIGLVVDGFTAWGERFVVTSKLIAKTEEQQVLRQWVRLFNRDLYKDMDQDMYLLRLLRATCFLAVTGAVGVFFIGLLCSPYPVRVLGVINTVSAAFAIASVIAWNRRRTNFEGNRNALFVHLSALRARFPDGPPQK